MTFIKLDPNLMQGLIKNLESYADEAEKARSDIHSSSVNNSHPVPEVDDATYLPAIFTVTSADAPTSRMMDTLNSMSINSNTGSSYNTTMGATINALGEVIDGLQERLQVIIDLNTDGISTTSSDGVPGYYLPDGTADTVENVKSYNTEAVATARADADALTQATASRNGTADDGRTVDEVLASMATYQDSPAYGATFVNTYGIEKFIELPISVYWHYTKYTGQRAAGYGDYRADTEAIDKANGILAHLLAGATQTEKVPDGFDSWADALYETSTVKGHRGRVSCLNELLSASNAVYDTSTLVNLATKMESQDSSNGGYYDGDPASRTPDQISGWHDAGYGNLYNEGRAFPGGPMDPMYGVMVAMGNNPEAAVEYLVPEGDGSMDGNGVWVPGQTTTDRWAMLTSRDWGEGAEPLTTAVAGASAMRVQSQDATDERAAWVTGKGLDYAAGLSEQSFSAKVKNNVAVILGNSMAEIEDGVTRTRDTSGIESDSWDSRRPAILADDHSEDFKTLMKMVGTDDTALATMTDAAGRFSTARTQAILDAHPDAVMGVDPGTAESSDSPRLREELQRGISNDGRILGFIEQSAVNGRKKQGEDEAAADKTVASTILGAVTKGLSSVPNPYAQGLGTAISLASPGITSATGKPDKTPVDDATTAMKDTQEQVFQSTMAQIANDGRFDESAFTNRDGTDDATGLDPNGDRDARMTPYAWMRPDHTIDTSALFDSDENRQQFNNWLDDNDIPSSNFRTNYQADLNAGKGYAKDN
nr:DUF6571 family protein [uncultured Actinomyces sp.]